MSTRRSLTRSIALVALLVVLTPTAFADTTPASPRLVLQLTIDQLRGDMLSRYHARFGKGGFRRLMDGGLYFTNAHYGTGNTFTASGHAVLVTGADTAEHGMVANEWFDRASGKTMYSTFDATHGMSPANLTSTTLGDELVAATQGRSRAFAVAGKDRSAIIPGGHLGKAYWFSDKDGGFTTSTWYYVTRPAWLQAWNNGKPIETYRNRQWQLLGDAASYLNVRNAANPHARPRPGATFPHVMVGDDNRKFLTAFRTSPFLDEHTLNFAEALIRNEKLGQGAATDYLSIGLSGTDYVGHAYGPHSLEYEDHLLRLDASLAAFLTFLDTTVGRDRLLVVLSADHGVDDIPEARRAEGYDADRFYPKKLLEQMNAALKARFQVTVDLVQVFVTPGFYLDRTRIAALGTAANAGTQPSAAGTEKSALVDTVAAALAAELRKVPGVAYAYTRGDLLAGRVPDSDLGRKIVRSFHPTRSGDVVIVQQQFWYLYHDPECCAAMHGSPYSYDTYVPVIFHGAGIEARIVSRAIEPASIAPTLAAFLNVQPPSGNSAPTLSEVLETRR
jgi:predicted AlkP superfamily pyrophosphatase or phosphodiesterase